MIRVAIPTLLTMILALSCAFLPVAVAAEDDWPRIKFTGSLKNLATASESPVFEENFWSDLTRLKLDLDVRFNEHVEIRAVVDNEFLIGDLLETPEFQFTKDLESPTACNLDTFVVDNEDVLWRANLFRAYLKLSAKNTDLTAGCQRIAWGTGRLWNPTDLFNPISPLQIERNQRDGVNAINLEHYFNELSGINLIYSTGEGSNNDSFAGRLKLNFKGYDYSFMAGEFREEKVVGFDFGGNIGAAGFRGEATYTNSDERGDFVRGVLSWDYSWPNTFYLLFEYLYNGGNFKTPIIPGVFPEATSRRFSGEIATKNQNFIGNAIGYEITPLWTVNAISVYDLDESSIFIGPTINWNVLTNLDWTTGAQFFAGSEDSEYGSTKNVYYMSLKYFF